MARTENLTVMFTDMVDYTERMAQQSRSESQRALREYYRVLLPVIARFGGRRVKSMGDTLLAVFRSPTDGVRCGMALQDAFAERNYGKAPADQIPLRVALNVGEVRVEGRDVHGEAVNVAARIQALTPRGEVHLTEALNLVMNRNEVGVRFVGEQKLKGIADAIRIYRVPQRVHRLMAVGSDVATTAEDVLPFGGVHHSAAQGAEAWLETAALRLRQAAWDWPNVSPRRYAALLAALAIAVGFDLWILFGPPLSPGVTAGAPVAAAAPSEAQSERNRTARRLLKEGHDAYAAGQRHAATARYAEALDLNPLLAADPKVASNLVGALGWAGEAATPLIRRYFNPVLRDELSLRSGRPGVIGRGRAIRLLTELGQARHIDLTGALLEELKEADTCIARRDVVKRLRAQRDPRALPALRGTLQGGITGWISNLCLRSESQTAIREIEQARTGRARAALANETG